jgi:subtilisin family serine protease
MSGEFAQGSALSLALLLSLVLAAAPVTSHGQDRDADRRVHGLAAAADGNGPAAAISPECLASPLPITPTGATSTFEASDLFSPTSFTAAIWRQPCLHDPQRSVVLMRVTPKPGFSAWVCGGSWRAEQGGERHTVQGWIIAAGIPSACSDFPAPTTFALEPRTGRFDDQKAFALSTAWLRLSPSSVAVAGYVPNLSRRTLTVEVTGGGSGAVTSRPAGISCASGTCSTAIYQDTPVALTATPKPGSLFAGWGGGCREAGNATTALITVTADAACTARFMPPPVNPESGWWWAPSEPGRGYSLELRNGRLFVASYDYRSDGAATWHLAQGSWDGYGLTAPLVQFGDGQTIGGTWRKANERGATGTVTFRFSTPARGTLSRETGRSVAIERFAFAGDRKDLPEETPTVVLPATDEKIRLQALRDTTLSQGPLRVIVQLHGSAVAAADGRRMQGSLEPSGSRIVSTFRTLPMFVAEVTTGGLDGLLADPSVAAVHADEMRYPFLAETAPLVGAPGAWSLGHAGRGQRVAVLDTGIESTHPFLAGRVVDEACFSTAIPMLRVASACPAGASPTNGKGSGAPCANEAAGCYHGTHVAGIVAGSAGSISGIAPGAELVSIQVFKVIPGLFCRNLRTCVGASDSDLIGALEYVRNSAAGLRIAAANLSLGGDAYSSYCDHLPHKPVIDQLRAAGVATIVAAGNAGENDAVAAPACISSAIRVGATTKLDALAAFSNEWASPLLLAPGDAVVSSLLGGKFGGLRGTSMAAPHVAGAWAVLRGAVPGASVAALYGALAGTGTMVSGRSAGRSHPRLDLGAALERLTELETGWWWNEAEPGAGYFVEIRNSTLFLSAYMYREDGSPAWYIANGVYVRGTFQGVLQEYGGPAQSDPWRGAKMVAEHGTMMLQSTGVGSARLTLPGGRQVALTRFSF